MEVVKSLSKTLAFDEALEIQSYEFFKKFYIFTINYFRLYVKVLIMTNCRVISFKVLSSYIYGPRYLSVKRLN